MSNYTEDELWELNDDELRAAFKEAKAEEASPDTDYENEDVVEDLEQPDEESDDNTSLEDDVEFDDGTESDTEESEPDEELDTDEDEPVKSTDKIDDDKQPVLRKYKANGKEYEFSDEEIFDKFGHVFGQAMDYTRKMQQIKPWRKTIDAIEQAKLSEDDVNLAIDVLKGDKEAIAALLKRTGVDALELDVDNVEYKPKDYGRNDTELMIKDIVEEISKDKEYEVTYDVLENQWDDKSRREFAENPDMIRQLHIDVKSGMFDTLMPIMQKMRVYDRGQHSDIDYYAMAARQYAKDMAQDEARSTARETRQVEREKVDQVKSEVQKREATTKASSKRKAAAPTGKSAGGTKVVDYLDDSDEAFESWYKRIQDSQ